MKILFHEPDTLTDIIIATDRLLECALVCFGAYQTDKFKHFMGTQLPDPPYRLKVHVWPTLLYSFSLYNMLLNVQIDNSPDAFSTV